MLDMLKFSNDVYIKPMKAIEEEMFIRYNLKERKKIWQVKEAKASSR